MSSRIHPWLLIAFCMNVTASGRPITEELTAVTNFPDEVENIFLRFHSETSTTTTDPQLLIQSKSEHNVAESPSAEKDPDTPTKDLDQDSVQQNLTTSVPDAPSTIISNSHQRAPTRDPSEGLQLKSESKEEICEYISSSDHFAMNHMSPCIPLHMLRNNPILSAHKETGGGRHRLPQITYENESKDRHIYVRGRKEPYVESMFSCIVVEGGIVGRVREYYVSDREYNMSENPTEYVAGRFLAIRDPNDKKLKLMGLAEQPAVVVVPRSVASLYASLKEKHEPSQKKYPIISRLTEGQTVRLCSSVMSGIESSFEENLIFYPSRTNIVMLHKGRKIVRLRMDDESDQSLDDADIRAISCKDVRDKSYHLIQAYDDYDGVYVSNDKNGVEVVRFYASGIAAIIQVQDVHYYSSA